MFEPESTPDDPSSAIRESGATAATAVQTAVCPTRPTTWSMERGGLEWVADHERRGSPRVLFWPWAAQGINVIIVAFGMYVAALGLGWRPSRRRPVRCCRFCFFAPFQAFLTVIGVPIAAWTGIFLTDLWVRRHHGYDRAALYSPLGAYGRLNWAGVGSLTAATAVGLGLVTSKDPHIGPLLGYWFTPTARDGGLGTSNLGVFVALGLAALAYAASHRGRGPSTAAGQDVPFAAARESEPTAEAVRSECRP